MKPTQEFLVNTMSVIRDYVPDILEEQQKLNELYDPEWERNYDDAKFALAAAGEVNEIILELDSLTSFFGDKQNKNFDKALEELVDVIHFYATRVIKAEPKVQTYADVLLQDRPTSVAEWLQGLTRTVSSVYATQSSLEAIILDACLVFDLTPDVLLTAYLHKNRKNQIRAGAGAFTRDISELKASEQSTFDFLHSEHWISLSAERFNNKLATRKLV